MTILKPEKGLLLVAEPAIIGDVSFNRSVLLLAEYNENGAVGFILNKPLKNSLHDFIPTLDSCIPIYNGGPVEQDNLYFVHKIPQLLPDSLEVSDGIFWGGNFESLKDLLNNNLLDASDIRFFLGYSGWGKEQLDKEMNENSWFVGEQDVNTIFSMDGKNLWKDKLLQKGGNYKLWANAPSNFNLN